MFSHFCERWFSRGASLLHLAAMCLVLCGATCAQTLGAPSSNGNVLTIDRVDPPNWWAGMPKPMLLVRGEGLRGAKFSLSDRGLKVEKVVASENGHWAQLWLSASPSAPETVTLTAKAGGEKAETRYTFEKLRPAMGLQGSRRAT